MARYPAEARYTDKTGYIGLLVSTPLYEGNSFTQEELDGDGFLLLTAEEADELIADLILARAALEADPAYRVAA